MLKSGPAFVFFVDAFVKDSGMKKKELAEKLGITPSSLSSYMTQRATFPHELVNKLIEEGGLDSEYVYEVAYGRDNAIAAGLIEGELEYSFSESEEEEETVEEVVE